MTRLLLQHSTEIEVPIATVLLMGKLISVCLVEECGDIEVLEAARFTAESFAFYASLIHEAAAKPHKGEIAVDPMRHRFDALTFSELLQLCETALYYDHERLRDVTAYACATRMVVMDTDQMRAALQEPDDLSLQCKATIEKENAWICKMHKQ